ncbi:MAG: hypothetical protein AAGC74_12100 [Verrucomicrobiota bacterium]
MFKRIIYDHWTEIIPLIGFFATFTVFLVATIRALLMKKPQRTHLANLPLDTHKKRGAPAPPNS